MKPTKQLSQSSLSISSVQSASSIASSADDNPSTPKTSFQKKVKLALLFPLKSLSSSKMTASSPIKIFRSNSHCRPETSLHRSDSTVHLSDREPPRGSRLDTDKENKYKTMPRLGMRRRSSMSDLDRITSLPDLVSSAQYRQGHSGPSSPVNIKPAAATSHTVLSGGKTSEVTGSIGDLMNLKKYYGSHSGSGGIASSVPNSDSMIARIVPLSTVFPKSSTSDTPLPSPEPLTAKSFKLNESLPTTHEEAREDSRTEPNDSDSAAESDESPDSCEDGFDLRREMEDRFPPIAEEGEATPVAAGMVNNRRQVLTSSQRTERLSRLIRQQRSSEHNLLTIQPRPIVS
ncbi:hypothetical protein M8J77_023464 [Diaphorina citri]|nr:hypothetical protein M8J77_023464 [Diaphorina citri]